MAKRKLKAVAGFRWSKEQRETAERDGKGLFAVGCSTTGGGIGLTKPIEHKLAEKLTLFCFRVLRDQSPELACAEIFGTAKAATPQA